MTTHLSTSLALGAAALFLGACNKQTPQTEAPAAVASESSADKAIKCFGVNECSGQAACGVPDGRVGPGSVGHTCAGLNGCAGKGWVSLPASECEAKGGEPL